MTHEYCVRCDPGGSVLRHRGTAAERFERELTWLSGASPSREAAVQGTGLALNRPGRASAPRGHRGS